MIVKHAFFRFIACGAVLAALCVPVSGPAGSGRLIPAAGGGNVVSPSGRAELIIPPGALAEDAEVTIVELPPGEGAAVGPVFDLQPDGLRFGKPATLVVRYKPTDIPKGRRPEAVAVMQVLPGPRGGAEGGIGAAAAAAGRPPYRSLKTTVDTAAWTASAELSHLSRYAARSYAEVDLGVWNATLSGPFDFGQSSVDRSGAADARAAYALDGGLEVIVQVPVGSDSRGWGWACLWQSFRVIPPQPAGEDPWFGTRDIEIPIRHQGRIGDGTNTYDIHYSAWLSSDRPGQPDISAGEFLQRGQRPGEGALPAYPVTPEFPPMVALSLPGIFWRSFSARPSMRPSTAWSPTPYRAERGNIMFQGVRLYRDHFYAVGVSLFVSIKGGPARGKRPPEGGAVSFIFGEFSIDPVKVSRQSGGIRP